MNVRALELRDQEAWLAMRCVLWPDCAPERVSKMHDYFSAGGPLATFVAVDTDGQLCGFIEASLRPHAEGCMTKPVAYIEGIFVGPHFRRRGVGGLLVDAVQRWAVPCRCVEFASDCHSDNEESIRFHRRVGFDIAKQLVHFRRAIAPA